MSFSVRRLLWPKGLAGKAARALLYLVVLYAFAHWRTSRSLAAAWALSDEVGLSNDVEVLRGPKVPDDRNMALVIDRAGQIASKFLDGEMADRGDYDERELYTVTERLSAVDSLSENTEYESQLRTAMSMTEYYRSHNSRRAYESNVGVHIQHRRSFARLEKAIVNRLEQTGRLHDAMRRLLRFHALTRRCLHGEPSLTEILCNEGVLSEAAGGIHRLLRRYRFAPSVYDDIEHELAATDQYRRLFLLAAQLAKFETVELYTDFLSEKGLAFFPPLVIVESESIVRFEHVRLLTYERSYRDAKDELKRLDDGIKRMEEEAKVSNSLRATRFLGSYSLSMRSALERYVVNNRCLRILNAMAKKGNFIANLDSLSLPDECLTDSFNGKRLQIKRDSDGPIIYSVGENLIDDGGDVYRWSKRLDVGLGPPRPEPENP